MSHSGKLLDLSRAQSGCRGKSGDLAVSAETECRQVDERYPDQVASVEQHTCE